MITQLLAFTRTRLGGGLTVEPGPSDLGDVCGDVVDELKSGAAIELDVEGDLTGTWDADRLAEVLSNIAGNAIEHADRGTIVEVKAYANGAEAVVVEIRNRGAPIPTEVLPFIFEPFRQARHQDQSKTGNLGLGLYISYQIVLAHGGTLAAHSFGGTTTFTVHLPRARPVTESVADIAANRSTLGA